jgi:N-acetyl-1-D-myo-inositol-2-amino-2-deoxy-alpha-D-glucopyranoside deacetylase
MATRRLALVHAHPDDESLGTGGTIAKYAAEGAHVCLITCTNGEMGEIADVPELGALDEIRPRLGEVRRLELEAACRALAPDGPRGAPAGKIDLRMLGYHDSGMDGTPENEAPVAFINQDMDLVVERVVEIFREVDPQVVVTYNEVGFYGHPDHIRAHEAAMRASEIVGVPKIYYTAFPKSLMRRGRDLASSLGVGDDFFSEEDIDRLGTNDDDVAAVIDCSAFVEHKFRALEAHRTQLGTTQMFLQIPVELRGALGHEHYVLARSSVARSSGTESDLFEGIGRSERTGR